MFRRPLHVALLHNCSYSATRRLACEQELSQSAHLRVERKLSLFACFFLSDRLHSPFHIFDSTAHIPTIWVCVQVCWAEGLSLRQNRVGNPPCPENACRPCWWSAQDWRLNCMPHGERLQPPECSGQDYAWADCVRLTVVQTEMIIMAGRL